MDFQAGFARVNVTPMLGIGVYGYFKPRYADGVLDELEINAIALKQGADCALLLSIDHCGIVQPLIQGYTQRISEVTNVPQDAIFIASTHTHNGPVLEPDSQSPLVAEYVRFLYHKLADAAQLAMDDLKPARFGWAVGVAPNIAFVRRFRMKDGSIRTNPGVGNPDILCPLGDVDERVNVLRFDRENADTIVLVNFGDHPDSVGGSKISADWPGLTRKTVEQALDGTKCAFFTGAQGDINHVKVDAAGGDLNDLFMDFDDVARGYGHARHMGRVVAGAVLQVYDKVNYTPVDSLRFLKKQIRVPSNLPNPEDMERAKLYFSLYKAGRDSEIPYTGMQLTTVVAEAERMVQLEHGPEFFTMPLTGIAFGNVAMIGLPGEPFTEIGRKLKEAPGWSLVLPCCNTNGKEGYFPVREAYDEGGYEARRSIFKAGVAELLIEKGLDLLATLRG